MRKYYLQIPKRIYAIEYTDGAIIGIRGNGHINGSAGDNTTDYSGSCWFFCRRFWVLIVVNFILFIEVAIAETRSEFILQSFIDSCRPAGCNTICPVNQKKSREAISVSVGEAGHRITFRGDIKSITDEGWFCIGHLGIPFQPGGISETAVDQLNWLIGQSVMCTINPLISNPPPLRGRCRLNDGDKYPKLNDLLIQRNRSKQ